MAGGGCPDGGKDPRRASQEGGSIRRSNRDAPARLLFWGWGERNLPANVHAGGGKSKRCVQQSQFPLGPGGGREREAVVGIGASRANCVDKIMKVFVCAWSSCISTLTNRNPRDFFFFLSDFAILRQFVAGR